MHVIGTAGHVDHGKSTLVKALTGIDPDRLEEEKARQMTIDLGFAWLTLPSGEEVGIVDVPGHIDFIKNMLAGVGGIDAVLLVIAADEGVMPQTREHLAIIDLLGVQRGLVIITKIDLVDEEWLSLVQEDVHTILADTPLANAPLIPCSAHTGQGLDRVRRALADLLAAIPPRPDKGRPRLSVDRVFTLAGFGTVVTGTLLDGTLAVGDEVEILPAGLQGRIRGLQTHKRRRERALPGTRVAVNISGVDKQRIRRGDVLTHPGVYRSTLLMDVQLQTVSGLSHPLRHNDLLHLFIGAAEIPIRLRLIGTEELRAGEVGWAQMALSRPAVAVRDDRFILRRPSPSETVGGGRVLNPFPGRKHRRFRPEVLTAFERLASDKPDRILEHYIITLGPAPLSDITRQSALGRQERETALNRLQAEGRVVLVDLGEDGRGEKEPPPSADVWAFSRESWERTLARLRSLLESYHADHPLRLVMPRQEVRSRLQGRKSWPGRLFNAIVDAGVARGWLVEEKDGLRLRTHSAHFSPEQQAQVDALLARFRARPYMPPGYAEVVDTVGPHVAEALVERGILVRVSDSVVFWRQTYEEMLARVQDVLTKEGEITVARARDLFGSSRKYVLAFLEYLDAQHITRRVGDTRVLRAVQERKRR